MSEKKRSNKSFILVELLFYVAFPYVIWNFGREPLGDYSAMLISTIPGIVYTLFRFMLDKQFNLTGIFILSSLVLGSLIDLLSQSAERMIWNGVYLGLFYTFLYFVTLIIKRPLSLYFAVDFAYLQGHARKDSKALFYQRGIFKLFQLIQVIFIIRGLFMAGLTVYLFKKYGIDGYGDMLIYKQIAGTIFSLFILGMYFYTNVPVRKFIAEQQNHLQDNNNLAPQQSNALPK